jgi:hypothetical protein
MRAKIAVVAAIVTALGLSACGGHLTLGSLPSPGAAPTAAHAGTGHRSAHGLFAVHDPGAVTGTLTGRCRARDNGQLPDRACTPGAIDPAVTQADIGSTICRSGYTTSVRPPESQTEKFKWGVAEPAYGQHDVPGELDHLVPLELGGANDARNLWVENYRGFLNADDKDRLENYLHDAVCSGRMPLQTAQEAIATDWVKAYCAARLGECPAGLQ